MSKHEYKVGDWVKFQINHIDEDGHLRVSSEGNAGDGWIKPQLATPATSDYSEWVGKKLSDAPDGTVAVVYNKEGAWLNVVLRGEAYWANSQLEPDTKCDYASREKCTILHIIKLGTPDQPIEMTVAEIEAKLGHAVKVVK